MRRKEALVTIELVNESIGHDSKQIELELQEWFREEGHIIPWVRDVKNITVRNG